MPIDTESHRPLQGANANVYALFERTLVTNGNRVAVARGEELVTYRQLEQDIDRIAIALLNQGAVPSQRVCIAVEHGHWLVPSILAVLKIGCTYVPIDTRHPTERLRHVVEDSDSRVLVYSGGTAGATRQLDIRRRICVDALTAGEPVESKYTSSTSLAYILYTSGSTGVPKGVGISHRNLTNYVTWARDAYIHSPNDRIALYTTLAFDFTVTCIFPPLVAGASIGIYDGISDPMVISEILADRQINVLKVTPSYLYVLDQMLDGESSLERVVVGGEDFKTSLAERVRKKLKPGAQLINEYGPTEATVGCVYHIYDPKTDQGPSVPIGLPIPNMRTYVVDEDGGIVSDERCGELCVAGESVAQGYLNMEGRTREAFRADPCLPDELMYRTGDIVKKRSDGNLVFLGRRDDQVKIRGNRVELAEVTAAILAHPEVTAAHVIAVAQHGTSALVAVVASRCSIEESALVANLRRRVPEYMVPSMIKVVSELPLTVNQKVDNAAILEIVKNERYRQ
jgi:amino acid adenylation domain-containing protein